MHAITYPFINSFWPSSLTASDDSMPASSSHKNSDISDRLERNDARFKYNKNIGTAETLFRSALSVSHHIHFSDPPRDTHV